MKTVMLEQALKENVIGCQAIENDIELKVRVSTT